MKRKKILIVLKNSPLGSYGSLTYINSIIKELKNQGFCTKLISTYGFNNILSKPNMNIDYCYKGIKFCKFIFCWNALFNRIFFTLYYLFNNCFFLKFIDKTSDFNQYFNNKEINYIKKIIKQKKFDTIIGNYVGTANLFDESELRENNIKTFLCTHDIINKRKKLFKEKKLSSYSLYLTWTKEEEINAWKKADTIVSIQKEETEEIKKMCPNKNVITVPVSFNIKMPYKQRKLIPFKKRIMYIAARSDVNIDGALTILSIASKLKDCIFNIYGTVCFAFDKYIEHPLDNVKFCGEIKNIESAYKNNDIAIVPLSAGSGLKIKTVEALSYSMPVVGTKYAFEGLRDSIGKCSFEGNNEEELMYQIENLTNGKKLYQNAIKEAELYFSNHFTPKIALKELVKNLEK